jgi:hypothetical protein
MIFTTAISRLFKGGKTESAHGKRINYPVRDWLVGLGIFAVIVLLGGVYSAHVFLTYRDVSALQGAETQSPVKTTYNANTVTEALAVYRARKEAFVALGKNPASEIGPTEAVVSQNASSSPTQEEGTAHLE